MNTRLAASGTLIVNATGERIEWIARESWGRLYYSVDLGDSWHQTKAAALRSAGKVAIGRVIKEAI